MRLFLLYIAFALSLCAGVASAQSADITSLSWLAGCWENAGPSTISEEQWMKPLGGSMIGMSRTVKDGKTRWHEFLQIRQHGDSLVYIADPSGQKKTIFHATTIAANEVVFENPEHDFPQRIIYHLNDDGSLHARLEGVQQGEGTCGTFSVYTEKVSIDTSSEGSLDSILKSCNIFGDRPHVESQIQ